LTRIRSYFTLFFSATESISRIGLRFLLSAIGRLLLKRDDVSICSSFLSSRTSLLLSLSVNLPSQRRCMYKRRERERERERGHARTERKRGSRVEWKRDGSIYRLLSSDAPGITFVRFASVDDVVAHGVGVISTREGTYPPITVPLAPFFLRAHTHASTWSFSFLPPPPSSFPAKENLPHRLFIYSLLYSRFAGFARREFRPDSRLPRVCAFDFYFYPNLYGGTSPCVFVINSRDDPASSYPRGCFETNRY